jgi:hypothetical protein
VRLLHELGAAYGRGGARAKALDRAALEGATAAGRRLAFEDAIALALQPERASAV